MDLTSRSQKSPNFLLVLAVFVGTSTYVGQSYADNSVAVVSDLDSTVSSGKSTLVIVESRSNEMVSQAGELPKSHNTLRTATSSTDSQLETIKRSNSLRNGLPGSLNRGHTLKLRTPRSTQSPHQTTAVANVIVSNDSSRSTPEINPPAPIQQTVSQNQYQKKSSVQFAEHQEKVVPVTEADPTAELLLNAHKVSQQASTEQDYTLVVSQCAKALQLGANTEYRGFAHQLSSWALNRRGQLRADNNQADLANADFRAALDYQPNNWRALHNRGVSFAQNGQFSEAFEDFNEVLELNPQYAKAYANRATLYFQANDLQSAIEDYQRAIECDSQLVTAQVGIARTYHQLGQWDVAIRHFTEAMQLDPTNSNIVCSRGDLLADMGNYRDALADYARTIELNPEFAHAYRNGAWLLATCPDSEFRDAENAILGAKQALEFNYGDRHVALDTLAAALANAGQYAEAIATLHEAIENAPAEAKVAYFSRLQLYQDQQPFRSHPSADCKQVSYEVSDQ